MTKGVCLKIVWKYTLHEITHNMQMMCKKCVKLHTSVWNYTKYANYTIFGNKLWRWWWCAPYHPPRAKFYSCCELSLFSEERICSPKRFYISCAKIYCKEQHSKEDYPSRIQSNPSHTLKFLSALLCYLLLWWNFYFHIKGSQSTLTVSL